LSCHQKAKILATAAYENPSLSNGIALALSSFFMIIHPPMYLPQQQNLILCQQFTHASMGSPQTPFCQSRYWKPVEEEYNVLNFIFLFRKILGDCAYPLNNLQHCFMELLIITLLVLLLK
jgi:hypothetical protein